VDNIMDKAVRERLHKLGGVELPTERELFVQGVKDNVKAVGMFFLICGVIVQCFVMALFGKSCK